MKKTVIVTNKTDLLCKLVENIFTRFFQNLTRQTGEQSTLLLFLFIFAFETSENNRFVAWHLNSKL